MTARKGRPPLSEEEKARRLREREAQKASGQPIEAAKPRKTRDKLHIAINAGLAFLHELGDISQGDSLEREFRPEALGDLENLYVVLHDVSKLALATVERVKSPMLSYQREAALEAENAALKAKLAEMEEALRVAGHSDKVAMPDSATVQKAAQQAVKGKLKQMRGGAAEHAPAA